MQIRNAKAMCHQEASTTNKNLFHESTKKKVNKKQISADKLHNIQLKTEL